jgi:hypothetical protein
MSRRRAELPKVSHLHLRKLQILNETGYDGRAIRSLFVRCLRFYGMRVRGAVRIVYSSVSQHHGCAAIGESEKWAGLNMVLSLPRDPSEFKVDQFARVVRHEVLHWRGARHPDMTPDILYCRGPAPSWAAGITILHAAAGHPAVADPDAARYRKLAHARTMLKRAETRARRAETIVKRWQRRVKAAERAAARALEAAAPTVDVAADKGGS